MPLRKAKDPWERDKQRGVVVNRVHRPTTSPREKSAGRWFTLDASCLSGAVAAESDHGNTTVRAPPANASSADPEEESKKVRTGLTFWQ